MGAAGDMLMAALLELVPDSEAFIARMNSLGLPNVRITYEPAVKCGIQGTKVRVYVGSEEETSHDAGPASMSAHTHDDHHHPHHEDGGFGHAHLKTHSHEGGHVHYTYGDICTLIGGLGLPETVKSDALAVYRLLGDAEAAVHGVPIENIHFHEVGSLDAVADIVGCSLLFHMLGADSITASPIHVGSGFVRCAHGILPVPTPATAYLLQGVPICGGKVKGELCTPTGAAILKHFVKRFGDMEPMCPEKIGCGMGTKNYDTANCVRVFLGSSEQDGDSVTELSCNLDDMTPEAIGLAVEILLDSGALDVFTTPIYMKKNRPAVMLTCLSRPDDAPTLSALMLRHTTTHGVRRHTCRRDVLACTLETVQTPYGLIRIKTASGYGTVKRKPEFEDVKSAAQRHGVPFSEVYAAALAASTT
jgi:uncharacterized protein (TIGR00299 family) protein